MDLAARCERDCSLSRSALWPRLEHHVERRLRRAAESRKAAARHDFTQTLFSRLRAERQPNFLRQRRRRAQKRGRTIKCAADGIEIVFQFVAGKRLDNHPRSIFLEPAM